MTEQWRSSFFYGASMSAVTETSGPLLLARQLEHLGAVNIGAAGTFVIRQPIGRTRLRADIARRLPFDAEIVMCEGTEIVRLMSHTAFSRYPPRPDVVRFVSVLSRRPLYAAAPADVSDPRQMASQAAGA